MVDLFADSPLLVKIAEANDKAIQQDLSISNIKEIDVSAVALRSSIHDYYQKTCIEFFSYETNHFSGMFLDVMRNEGCSLLVKNINENMESILHAKRLTTRLIQGLEELTP